MFSCPTCNKPFPTKQSLGGHMSSHNRGVIYKAKRRNRLEDLNLTISDYSCEFCGKKHGTGKQLGGHMTYCMKNPKSEETVKKSGKGFLGRHHTPETLEILRKSGGYRKE